MKISKDPCASFSLGGYSASPSHILIPVPSLIETKPQVTFSFWFIDFSFQRFRIPPSLPSPLNPLPSHPPYQHGLVSAHPYTHSLHQPHSVSIRPYTHSLHLAFLSLWVAIMLLWTHRRHTSNSLNAISHSIPPQYHAYLRPICYT